LNVPTPRIPPPPPPFPPQRPSAFRQIVVIALGVFGGVALFVVVGFFLANCERFTDAYKAGAGGPEAMEEHRRKYPPRP
jgi:hypothetical protein